MGLYQRKSRNETNRANGNEPVPGAFAGVKRWMRYHKRIALKPIRIKNPADYVSGYNRRLPRG